MHPGVREAAVVRDGRDNLVAFVVPDDAYMDNIMGRGSAGITVIDKWRKTYDLTQFTKEAVSAPVGFNTLSWNSSFTRQPIPAGEMREWIQKTVAAISLLTPSTVYEIGCGTGMLLLQIAPTCQRYVAVDFSPVVLERLREQLRTAPSVAERVEVMERRADNFVGLDQNSFDTVIINSVTQHFPNLAYLTRVLENAINIVKPGGHVFVGNVRSLPVLEGFDSSVELFHASDEISVRELRDRIRRRVRREPQLVLSPACFLSLRRRFQRISRVEIEPRHGRSDNEMSRYRFNAILHVEHEAGATSEAEFQDWTERELTLDEIRSMLRGRNEAIGIQRIRNARLDRDIRILERLRIADAMLTVGELRDEIEQCGTRGIHPQDLIDLSTEDLGFQVLLSWAACRADGSYDALFIPTRFLQRQTSSTFQWPKPELSSFVRLANAPGQSKFRADLLDRVMLYCKQCLPESKAPDEIALVDMLPRTANGIVVSEALLAARLTCS